MTDTREVELLRMQLQLLEMEKQDRWENPHKYFDLYEWQDDFIYQKNHIETYGRYPHRLYITCANQVGKTFAGMGLAHMLCTDVEFRQRQWGNNQPRVIWYVLPTQDHINEFFEDKWEMDVLSKGKAKDEGPYAWKALKKGKDYKGIKFFATGCTLQFITLAAKSSSHQGRSVGAVLFDEEPPEDKLAEIEVRTAAFNDPETGLSNAILAFFFTPTSAQDYFKDIFSYQDEKFLSRIPKDLKDKYFLDKKTETHRTVTEAQEKRERFPIGPTVYKRRVSTFEAQEFLSGKPGRYNEARIRELIKDQPTKKDVLVRVFAAFEKEDNGGLIYKYFNKDVHIKYINRKLKANEFGTGIITAGLDYGSGSNHPGGVVVTHISSDLKRVRIIRMWRGEKGKVTTAEDIVDKYLEMTQGMQVQFPFYDHSCADLNTIHWRKTGKELLKAQKAHDIGVGLVDTLFRNNMLQIYSYPEEPYGDWIASEYENISHSTAKKDRLDELSDCVRYSLAGVAHLFDFKDLVPVDARQLIKEKIKKIEKKPEDWNVRSWDNVPDEDNDDIWADTELSEWEDIFNG